VEVGSPLCAAQVLAGGARYDREQCEAQATRGESSVWREARGVGGAVWHEAAAREARGVGHARHGARRVYPVRPGGRSVKSITEFLFILLQKYMNQPTLFLTFMFVSEGCMYSSFIP
jgi:hypothetical protein